MTKQGLRMWILGTILLASLAVGMYAAYNFNPDGPIEEGAEMVAEESLEALLKVDNHPFDNSIDFSPQNGHD